MNSGIGAKDLAIYAAVTTGKGVGAIASVELFGDGADEIVADLFRTPSAKQAKFAPGDIHAGNIIDGDSIIDNVVVACMAADDFAVNCHGNPLIVESVMRILKSRGARLVSADQLLAHRLARSGNKNTIEIEATIESAKAVSLRGAKLIANQADNGLSAVARNWLKELSIEDIVSQCNDIIKASEIAARLITGVKIVIAGPPNSGKSTLLNCLAGRQKAIVTDIPGTTRDWVSATFKAGDLRMELIDTAGLDETIVAGNTIDSESQRRSIELLESADMMLLVIDSSVPINENIRTIASRTNTKILAVFNKSDLGQYTGKNPTDYNFAASVTISAKDAAGIDALVANLTQVLETDTIGPAQPICFTPRQEAILRQISKAPDRSHTKTLITELLNGKVSV